MRKKSERERRETFGEAWETPRYSAKKTMCAMIAVPESERKIFGGTVWDIWQSL